MSKFEELKTMDGLEWSWSIETPSGEKFGVTKTSYPAAIEAWNHLKTTSSDAKLIELMSSVDKYGIGTSSRYGDGYQIKTEVRAIVKIEDGVHWCPRRGEGGPGPRIAKDGDHWRVYPNGLRSCSYCGSLHPEDMKVLLIGHGLSAIEPSDKGYKWYLARPFSAVNAQIGPIKYYRMHDTPELVEVLRELIEKSKESRGNNE